MIMNDTNSASAIAEIDILRQQIAYEMSHPLAQDDQLNSLFDIVPVRGRRKIENLTERLRRYLNDQNVAIRAYATGQLDALGLIQG